MIPILLVDDQLMIREAVAGLLDAQPDMRVVGQAGGLVEGGALVRVSPVELEGAGMVLVCDVTLPDGSGLDLVREARALRPALGIVVLTMHEDDKTIMGAFDAGASAMVRKSSPVEVIVAAIKRAASAPLSFHAEGLGDALRRARERPTIGLTPREMEVLELIAAGSSIADVAKTLYMSQSTAKTHVSKIYSKLGAHNRASAVRAALTRGLIRG